MSRSVAGYYLMAGTYTTANKDERNYTALNCLRVLPANADL